MSSIQTATNDMPVSVYVACTNEISKPIMGGRKSAKHQPGRECGQRGTGSTLSEGCQRDVLAMLMHIQLAKPLNEVR